MPDDTLDVGKVENEETLYRSIWLKKECFGFDEEGNLRVSPQAFADKRKQPSVFRHHLCDAPPASNPPRLGTEQAVVSLTAGRVRETMPIEQKSENADLMKYIIDVRSDTSNGQHRAHAVVFADPDFKTNRPFEKLTIRLAQLVEDWAIMPSDNFIEGIRPGKS